MSPFLEALDLNRCIKISTQTKISASSMPSIVLSSASPFVLSTKSPFLTSTTPCHGLYIFRIITTPRFATFEQTIQTYRLSTLILSLHLLVVGRFEQQMPALALK